LDLIFDASNGSTINHVHQSQKNFYIFYENSFLVLPDGKTIVGADADDYSKLICEDITRNDSNAYSQIAKHEKRIYTVFYNVLTKTLFVGDYTNVVIEYKQNGNNLSWTETKNYGDIDVGCVLSVTQIGDILLFGGYSSYKIRAIDTKKKTLLSGTLETPFGCNYSLQVCELLDKKLYLSICGRDPNYSGNKTDIYDVTNQGKIFNYQFKENVETSSDKLGGNQDQQNDNTCGCNSKITINSLFAKLEHYLEVFAGQMFSHFNKRLLSTLSKIY
jgi:hypothetical protein